MNKNPRSLRVSLWGIAVLLLLLAGGMYYVAHRNTHTKLTLLDDQRASVPVPVVPTATIQNVLPEPIPDTPSKGTVEYTGKIEHIFFHSLIVYPKKAHADSPRKIVEYKNYMVTADQFKEMLSELYQNNFMLIDSRLIYSFDAEGKIHRNTLFLPKNKKPLILSLDDLSYYAYMKNGGFANRLVLDNGIVKTEVRTPEAKTIFTNDGDVVPIVDDFVKRHPDFSLNGAKGIIALTGYEGVLGYRTQQEGTQGDIERNAVVPIVNALKQSGWIFASHSYTHEADFASGKISTTSLALDIASWSREVEPLVGRTNIFIGPFGQVFKDKDPRRKQLLDAGFSVLYGVGMEGYLRFFDTYVAMDRADIDGYRLTHNTKELAQRFGIAVHEAF